MRMVISLDPKDKAWLDRQARERRVPMTQIVREAIRRLRKDQEAAVPDLRRVLQETAGIWRGEDGLSYQRAIRTERDSQGGPKEELAVLAKAGKIRLPSRQCGFPRISRPESKGKLLSKAVIKERR